MRVFNESLFNKLSENNKDLNYMNNIENTDDFVNSMKSFGVEFDETDIKVLESISESDSVEILKSKLKKIGIETNEECIEEVLSKLKKEKKFMSKGEVVLSDKEMSNVNGGYDEMTLFAIGLVTSLIGVGTTVYGTYKIVKGVKNKITGAIGNKNI